MTTSPIVRNQAGARFLPVQTLEQWLDPSVADELLAYAIDNETRFESSAVLHYGHHKVDAALRRSSVLRELGPFHTVLTAAALNAKPDLEKAFGVPAFNARKVEVELAAHGDGASFQRHIDTFVVINRAPSTRVLTLVLYLHRTPCGFTGGAIRMYALGATTVRDIAPDHNLLVAFPAFAPHSVETVCCPSGAFADHRFALNMWVHR